MTPSEQIAIAFECALVAASAATWLVLARRVKTGKRLRVNSQPRAAISPLTVVLSLLAFLFVLAAFKDLLSGRTGHYLEDVIIACVSQAFCFVALIALVSRDGDYKHVGVSFESFGRQVKQGAIAFVLSIVPVAAMMLCAVYPMRKEENQHGLLKAIEENPTLETLAIVFLAAGILAPLVEELIFRVILQGALQRTLRPQQAIMVVAVLFSLIHTFPDMFAIFPLAVILGFTYFITHSYWSVVVAHMLFNTTNIVILFLSLPAKPID